MTKPGQGVACSRIRLARRRPHQDRPRTFAVLTAWVAAAAAVLGVAEPARADAAEAYISDEFVRVKASDRYKANRVHRWALGGGYRDLWEAEIELPLLKLETAEGPLEPTGRFGGLQTAVLGLKSPDGRAFSFRGTDKDPSAVLPELLHDTIVQALVQDMMAVQHPGGPIASGVVSEAAGLLTIHETMVVMPDSPLLGKYREEFAGMIGTWFEFPTPRSDTYEGFERAAEIIGHKELYEKLRASQDDQVDIEAFLRARLFDILIGDFDRHRKQWRWAKTPGDELWDPIPEDRDMAFVRYSGVLPRTAYIYVPILQQYSDTYPWIKGLTLHGWEQDRYLLPKMSWETWERIAKDIQSRVTDDVIDRAIAALPKRYAEFDGEHLRRDLRGRRDRLVEGARSFYEHLAGQVNVEASDASEQVEATWGDDGSLHVEVRAPGSKRGNEPVFSRRFHPSETNDVRIYLRGGDDAVKISGDPSWRMTLRVISDSGKKTVDDSAAGDTRIYDENGTTTVTRGPGTVVDTRHYEPPEPDSGFVDVEDVPPRDWGFDLIPIPQFGYEKDVGVFIGAGAIWTRYGFRKHPWSQKHTLTAGYATTAERERLRYVGQFRFENSPLLAILDAEESGIEVMRFYGFGNDTSDDDPNSFYRARNRLIRVAPALEARLCDDKLRISGGPWLEYSSTLSGDRLINQNDPETGERYYGTGNFGNIGLYANVRFDTRTAGFGREEDLELPFYDHAGAAYPTSGFLFDLTGEISPEVWGIDQTWGALEGSISAFHAFGEQDWLTLGLRIGGRNIFGDAPLFQRAFIGGGEFFSGSATVRGLRAQRYAGDASLYGNFDARIAIGRFKIIVPTHVGLLGFADLGRVWEDGQSSKKWHPGGGGGFWFAPLSRTNAITFAVGVSEEETLFYMRIGFFF